MPSSLEFALVFSVWFNVMSGRTIGTRCFSSTFHLATIVPVLQSDAAGSDFLLFPMHDDSHSTTLDR